MRNPRFLGLCRDVFRKWSLGNCLVVCVGADSTVCLAELVDSRLQRICVMLAVARGVALKSLDLRTLISLAMKH